MLRAASLLLLVYVVAVSAASLQFAAHFGDHMVLQRAPQQAIISGVGTPTDTVAVYLNDELVGSGVVDDSFHWSVTLPAVEYVQGMMHTILAKSGTGETVSMQDVLFGDVWLCAGQSNMEFTTSLADDAETEIADAINYPNIRLAMVGRIYSSDPLPEVSYMELDWSVATPETVGGPDWYYFSATCWFFAKNLYLAKGIPLGMIDSAWGGTTIEAWSSADALAQCDQTTISGGAAPSRPGQEPMTIYNAMIYPLLQTTIRGMVWWQGESNTFTDNFECKFVALVNDYRSKWAAAVGDEFNLPFGFVQLGNYAPGGNVDVEDWYWIDTRWRQTGGYGYAPNPRLMNTWMAVAMDLPDFDAPFGSIHPRYKFDVGYRLALGARAIAYGEDIAFAGPYPTSVAQISDLTDTTFVLTVNYDMDVDSVIETRANTGFEVETADGTWVDAFVVDSSDNTVTISGELDTPAMLTRVRYNWATNPCELRLCAVYSQPYGLPAPPTVLFITGARANWSGKESRSLEPL